MKTSELIKELEVKMKTCGDLNVFYDNEICTEEVINVYCTNEPSTTGSKEKILIIE